MKRGRISVTFKASMARATCASMPNPSSSASVLAVRASTCAIRHTASTMPAASPTPGENSRAPSHPVITTAAMIPKRLGRRCAQIGASAPPNGVLVTTCAQ